MCLKFIPDYHFPISMISILTFATKSWKWENGNQMDTTNILRGVSSIIPLSFFIAKQLNRMTSFREQVLNLEQYTSWYMCTVSGWYASSSHFTLTLKVCD